MSHRGITDEDLAKLVQRVREATGALMQGDIHRYLGLVNHAPDSGLPARGFRLATGTPTCRRAGASITMEQLSLLARGSVEPGRPGTPGDGH
jgi:hypothetical protein